MEGPQGLWSKGWGPVSWEVTWSGKGRPVRGYRYDRGKGAQVSGDMVAWEQQTGGSHRSWGAGQGPGPAVHPPLSYLCQELVTLQQLHLGLQLSDVGGRGICNNTGAREPSASVTRGRATSRKR